MASLPIEVQSPTRIDLCGGTLDIYPLYLLFDGVNVINISIDLMTTCTIEESNTLKLSSVDTDIEERFQEKQYKLDFHQNIAALFELSSSPIHIKTDSMIPQGSGLGGSSSLLISMISAINKYLELGLSSHDIRQRAQNVESKLLGVPTGTQDYLAAQHHGLNIFEHSWNGIYRVEDTELSSKFTQELVDHMTLIYTGQSHHSANENWQIFQKVINKEKRITTLFSKLKEISKDMTSKILDKNVKQTIELIDKEWQVRKQLLPQMENLKMNELRIALEQEDILLGMKGCGAGAGGSLVMFSNKKEKEDLSAIVRDHGAKILEFNPFIKN